MSASKLRPFAVFFGALVLGVILSAVVRGTLFSDDAGSGGAGGVNERGQIGSDTVVLLGDSLTFNGSWEELMPGYDVVNHGYSQTTTDQLLPIAEEIAAEEPGVVIILAGTNDLSLGTNLETTRSNLTAIIDIFEETSPDTEIVLQTILPRLDRALLIPSHNQMIRQLASSRQLEIIDLHETFNNGFGALRLGETSDGIHLTRPGYLLWSAELRLFLDNKGLGPGGDLT